MLPWWWVFISGKKQHPFLVLQDMGATYRMTWDHEAHSPSNLELHLSSRVAQWKDFVSTTTPWAEFVVMLFWFLQRQKKFQASSVKNLLKVLAPSTFGAMLAPVTQDEHGRENWRTYQGSYVVAALAAITASPQSTLIRKGLQWVTHSQCYTTHNTHKTWWQQPASESYSQEEHVINRKTI